MAEKLRFGFLSTGNIARQFAAGVRDSDRCVLGAVGSRREASAREFAQAQGVARSYGSYEAVLKDPEVDAVYNALPNSMHHEWTIRALEAGKHVLCEKPFALNVGEAEEMFAVARRTGRTLVEAFMYRSHPQTAKLLEVIGSGEIGQVRLIRASFCFKITKTEGNVRFDLGMGGGSLMDIGCYCVDFAKLVAGCEPIRVAAMGRRHESGVDEMAVGMMEFPQGVLASFSCGMTAAADNAAQICGTEGYIQVPIPWKPPVEGGSFTISRGIRPKMEGGGVAEGGRTVRIPPGKDLYAYEADDFAGAVLEGRPVRVPAESTISTMRILDELRRQVTAHQGA